MAASATSTTTSPRIQMGVIAKSGPTLKHALVLFADGSVWQLGTALSEAEDAPGDPPFRATQVFEAKFMSGTEEHKHVQALIKMSYQIKNEQAEERYKKMASDVFKVDRAHQSEDERGEEYDNARALLRLAQTPTRKPVTGILNEIRALRLLSDKQCANTPRLLSFSLDYGRFGIDKREIQGGFVIFALMTKVEGKRLSAERFSDYSSADKEEIRLAFRNALTNVWKANVKPLDTGIHNIKWSKKQNKCYIIDFERFEELKGDNADEQFKDDVFARWGLADGM